MATNDFQVFAGGAGANVLSQSDWLALAALGAGFSSGMAQSAACNKAWRQSSIMAAVLAQLIVDNTGQNATDDGTMATLLANLKKAVGGRLLGPPRIFTSSTTYTPTPGTNSIIVEVQGGGGGGGGAPATSSSQYVASGGGASGCYAKSLLTSGFSGVTITVGSAGSGGVAGANNGSQGGTSSFGALISCPGGFGGVGQIAVTNGTPSFGQVTGTQNNASGGNIINGSSNTASLGFGAATNAMVSGSGCASQFGGGGKGIVGSSAAGNAAVSYGAGGGGAANNSSGSALAGGSGGPGVVIIWEYA
ncbi:hypothetical protein SAMN04487785_11332 [Dyella jiangningensis]|uniref:glycine-rich domain-containing protein n=1 Tax=Dyella sp. AtDHG13 TaxID=1938897 RepID=UPI000884123B|nr:hypothetical protein [Dyella sp. AtDHG13]PXV60874.1 hypothetical protein BDW41_102605 [Dyella sp. AtDHG13]SDK94947.1 hypothetical protein SAMN04487785_11332 [Dyella jiangningensis]